MAEIAGSKPAVPNGSESETCFEVSQRGGGELLSGARFQPPPAKPAPSPVGGGEKGGSAVAGFSFGKVKYKTKKGVATLPVNVTGLGSLKLSGKHVKTSTARAKAAGTFTFTIRASGKAASKLASTGQGDGQGVGRLYTRRGRSQKRVQDSQAGQKPSSAYAYLPHNDRTADSVCRSRGGNTALA